jgi:hypothetical protein
MICFQHEETGMRALMLGLVISMMAGSALAGPTCTSEPKDNCMSEDPMKAKLATDGYKYKVFKVTTGNCYEIYGQDEKGQRVEIYFHPITGVVVEEHKS